MTPLAKQVAIQKIILLLEGYVPGDMPPTPESRLYHDLGMAGEDYHDFVVAYSHRFQVLVDDADLRQLAPGEASWSTSDWLGRTRTYLEVTVQDLADFVQAGAWDSGRLTRRS